MLVLPFFLGAAPGDTGGAVAAAGSVLKGAEVMILPGEPALFEARRFRGLSGVAGIADVVA